MAMYSSRYLCSRALCNRSPWLLAHTNELPPRLGLCLWGWHSAPTVLLFWKPVCWLCSSPACPSCRASLATAGCGSLSQCSVAGPRAVWRMRQAGSWGCQAMWAAAKENCHLDLDWGEAPAWWGQYRWATLTARSPWEHSYQWPVSSCGGSASCGQQVSVLWWLKEQGKARGWLLPTVPRSMWEKWEQRYSGAGVPAGGVREMYPSLSPSNSSWQGWAPCPRNWGGGCTPRTWSEPIPAPGLALLYNCLPSAAGRSSKIKVLTATRSVSLCSFIYR